MVGNTVAAATILSRQSSLDGDWSGSISVGGQTIPLSVHFTAADDGLSAAVDIHGVTGLALQNVSYDPPRVHFELPAGAGLAVFDGEHAGDSIGGAFTQSGITGTFTLERASAVAVFDGEHAGDSIGGAFTQSGITGTFLLTRSVAEAVPTDVEAEPLPYDAEEVTFHNADITLAGTLTLPRTGAPHPAVVMITGSGAQNRDKEFVPEFLPLVTDWILERVQ